MNKHINGYPGGKRSSLVFSNHRGLVFSNHKVRLLRGGGVGKQH